MAARDDRSVFDWVAFEDELVAGLVAKVTEVAEGERRLYAAALGNIYAEADGVISLPSLGVNSEEELAGDEDVRWSPPDWDNWWDSWLPGDRWRHWERTLTAEAGRGSSQRWHRTFKRYLTVLTGVCKRSRAALRASSVTDDRFVVVVLVDERREEVLRRVLGVRELYRLFPEYDQRAGALARLAGMTPADQAAFYVQVLDSPNGPIGWEEAERALCGLGVAAVPALIERLSHGDNRWQAAKLLADIGHASDAVITALTRALRCTTSADRDWVARALSRLGRLDLVMTEPGLPAETVVTAVAAPFSSFRDHAVAPPLLDYRLIDLFLAGHPHLADALAGELKAGSGYCTIRAEEVDIAVDGLRSPRDLIRQHAVCVLGERGLGPAVGRRVTPLLAEVVISDPVADIRRLAILSLLWWKHDARHCAATIRSALNDPAREVREAAQHWLREFNLAAL